MNFLNREFTICKLEALLGIPTVCIYKKKNFHLFEITEKRMQVSNSRVESFGIQYRVISTFYFPK